MQWSLTEEAEAAARQGTECGSGHKTDPSDEQQMGEVRLMRKIMTETRFSLPAQRQV